MSTIIIIILLLIIIIGGIFIYLQMNKQDNTKSENKVEIKSKSEQQTTTIQGDPMSRLKVNQYINENDTVQNIVFSTSGKTYKISALFLSHQKANIPTSKNIRVSGKFPNGEDLNILLNNKSGEARMLFDTPIDITIKME